MFLKQSSQMVLLVALIVGTVSCSVPTRPEPITFPTTFEDLELIDVAVVAPLELPEVPGGRCLPRKANCDFIGFDEESFLALQKFRVTAEGNTEIATAMSAAAEDTVVAYNNLILAGRKQEVITQIREDQLHKERQEHAYETFWNRVLVVLALAVGIAAGG